MAMSLPLRSFSYQQAYTYHIPSCAAKPSHFFPLSQQNNPPLKVKPPHASSSDADDDVKLVAELHSPYNHIRVLDVSRRAVDHPLAGARLLLLDEPGNIHSISFRHHPHPLTFAYFDVFATLPPILPPGPVAVLGFGAGSVAKLLCRYYPDIVVHGYELDASVVAVAREFFGLQELELQHCNRLFVHIGDALDAGVDGAFSGVFVDLFKKGSVIPELQDAATWERIRMKLSDNGRVMVNCGGGCVEAEEKGRDGEAVKDETLKAMSEVFGARQVLVLNLGEGKEDDNWMAVTGALPEDLAAWKRRLPEELRGYVDMWRPYAATG